MNKQLLKEADIEGKYTQFENRRRDKEIKRTNSNMTESNRLEYKRELNADIDIEKEVVAFLNYREGGLLYIGIDKDGETVGIVDPDGDMLKIKDRIKNNISPSAMGLFDVVLERRDNKDVIKVIVASGNEKPYYKQKFGMTPKGCYIRIGTAAEPMTQSMIESLFANRTRNSIGKIKSNRQDLTFEQLKIYYDSHHLNLNSKFASNLSLQTAEGDYNYVGYLMADNNAVSVRFAKYRGKSRVNLIQNSEYGFCSLIKATKQVLDRLDVENTTKSKITYQRRIDTRLWSVIAIKEAVINAMIHNDYTSEVAPKIEIFDDRIEITSVGGLPEKMTREEFFMGLSMPRNPELMRIFKDIELVEHLGSGIPRILEVYPESCFVFTENFLRITFPNAWDLGEDRDEEANMASSEDNMASSDTNMASSDDNIPSSRRVSVENIEKQILSHLEDYQSIDEIAILLKRTPKYLKNFFIVRMVKENKLQRLYPDNPTHPKQKYKRKRSNE